MKSLFLTILTIAYVAMNAQVTDITKTMSKGNQPGLEILIDNAKMSDIEDQLNNKVKEYKGKLVKPEKGSFEYKALALKIDAVDMLPTDWYAFIFQEGTQVRMTCFFYNQNEVIKSDNPKKYDACKKVMTSMFNKVLFAQYEEKTKKESSVLKDLNSDLKKLEGDKASAEKDIVKSKEQIAKSEEEVKSNSSSKEKNETRLKEQTDKVTAKTAEIAQNNKKALEDELKLVEGELKTMQKENDGLKDEMKDKVKYAEKYGKIIDAYNAVTTENGVKIAAKEEVVKTKKAFMESNFKVKEEELKVLTKEKEKIEGEVKDNAKAIEKGNSNIASQNTSIKENEAKIEKSKADQAKKSEEIKAQDLKVKDLMKEQEKYKP